MLSHSASGHVYCQRLESTCADQPKALILMDPVDGFDPWGIIHRNIVPEPPATLSFIMPSLIIASLLSNEGSTLTPACTNPSLSNLHFFNGLAGPTWFLRFEEYGHSDLLDSPLPDMAPVCNGCHNCILKRGAYHGAVATLIDTFLNGIFQRNEDKLAEIEQPESLLEGFKVYHEFNSHGYDVL